MARKLTDREYGTIHSYNTEVYILYFLEVEYKQYSMIQLQHQQHCSIATYFYLYILISTSNYYLLVQNTDVQYMRFLPSTKYNAPTQRSDRCSRPGTLDIVNRILVVAQLCKTACNAWPTNFGIYIFVHSGKV